MRDGQSPEHIDRNQKIVRSLFLDMAGSGGSDDEGRSRRRMTGLVREENDGGPN